MVRVPVLALGRGLAVYFVASEGPGSNGTLYAGSGKTRVKGRKMQIGKGLLAKMLAGLGIERCDFEVAERTKRR